MIYVCSVYDKIPPGAISIDVTSRNKKHRQDLSPFYLPGGKLYGKYKSKTVENAWQFCKVYNIHTDKKGNPSKEYFKWAVKGWESEEAIRYPMGKGNNPLYMWWKGKKLSYIEGRRKIYIPLYSRAVVKTKIFQELSKIDVTKTDLYIRDFDGYNHRALGLNYDDVICNEEKSLGHGFVLAMLLEGNLNYD